MVGWHGGLVSGLWDGLRWRVFVGDVLDVPQGRCCVPLSRLFVTAFSGDGGKPRCG